MSQVQLVSSSFFDREKGADTPLDLTVKDPSNVKDLVENYLWADHGMVTTVCRVDVHGKVSEAFLLLVSPIRWGLETFVLPTNQVFPTAPKEWKINLKRDYSKFTFPPGAFKSDWVKATDLDVHFMYGSRTVKKECTEQDKNKFGLTDFLVRLCIKAKKDPTFASAFLEVAVPVSRPVNTIDDLTLAPNSHGYPVVFTFQQKDLTVGPQHRVESKKFGLPFLPILWMTGTQDPKPLDVLEKARDLWALTEWRWPAFQISDLAVFQEKLHEDIEGLKQKVVDDNKFKLIDATRPSLTFLLIWLLFSICVIIVYARIINDTPNWNKRSNPEKAKEVLSGMTHVALVGWLAAGFVWIFFYICKKASPDCVNTNVDNMLCWKKTGKKNKK